MSTPFSLSNVACNYFGKTLDTIVEMPHVLFEASEKNWRMVRDVIDWRWGIWGDYPVTSDDLQWIYFDEPSDFAARFKDWAKEDNQRYVGEYGIYAKLGCNTMLINALLPQRVVEIIYADTLAAPCTSNPYSDQGAFMTLLCKWIDAIGVAYTPLSDEESIALLLGSPSYRSVIEAVINRLNPHEIPLWRVQRQNDDYCISRLS